MLLIEKRHLHRCIVWIALPVFLLSMGVGLAAERKAPADSITLRTELDTYTLQTQRILVYWINGGRESFGRNAEWELQRWTGLMWKTVAPDESVRKNIGEAISGDVAPGEKQKVVYDLQPYMGKLTGGRHRIAASFLEWDSVSKNHSRQVYAEFQIVDDEKFVDKSELNQLDLGPNYRDITPGGTFDETTAHIYKHRQSYHSVLVYKGKKYHLGEYEGGLGVTYARYFADGKNEYLLYAYSHGDSPRQSRVAVFDLNRTETVFLSPAMSGSDVLYLQGNQVTEGEAGFTVYWARKYVLDRGGVSGYGDGKRMGKLQYRTGSFQFLPER